MVAADLEPLPPGEEPDDAPAPIALPGRRRLLSRRRRRQVVVAAVIVVASVVGAAVAQNVLDGRATRRAVAAFDAYEGADYLLEVEGGGLSQQMVPDDQPIVDVALARAERAQAAAYAALDRGLGASPLLDGSTKRLVSSVHAVLQDRIRDLDALAAWHSQPAASRGPQPPDPSPASGAAALEALARAAHHTGHPAAMPPLPQLNVDLTRWSDLPTGTLLVVADGSSVQLVNVDASTSVDLQLTGTIEPVVARTGYVAAVTPGGAAVAKPPAVAAPAIELGLAGQILPAVEPDAVWLVNGGADTATGRPTTTVTEVDGNGRRLTAPARVPDGQSVTGGVTNEGLVVTAGGGRLAVWDPATGHQTLVTRDPSSVLAASGDLLAWQPEDDTVVDVTDLRTGATDALQLPPGNMIVTVPDVAATTCAFSPDGNRLACPVLALGARGAAAPSLLTDPYHVAVIDVGAGRVQVSRGAVGRANAHPLVWSEDGSRLWAIVPTNQGSLVATWPSGAPSAASCASASSLS